MAASEYSEDARALNWMAMVSMVYECLKVESH